MKIVMYNGQVFPFCRIASGPAKHFYYLARSLTRLGVDVEFVVSAIEGRQRETFEGMTYTFLKPFAPAFFDPEYGSARSAYLRLRLFGLNAARYLRRQQFDIVHTFVPDVYWYLRLRRHRPVVLQMWEETYMKLSYMTRSTSLLYSIQRGLVSPVTHHMVKYCITHSDLVTFTDEFGRGKIKEIYGLADSSLLHLPLGVDTGKIRQCAEKGSKTRADLGLAADDFVIISANHLYGMYDTDSQLEAIALAKQRIARLKLILVGAGPGETQLHRKIRELNLADSVLHFKGIPENDLYSFYALADMYLCSLTGDLSMGVIEGMASGLPVVSTAMDFCVKNGLNGYVVPRHAPAAMAEAVLRLHGMGDGRRAMGEESRRLAADYDWDRIAALALSGYERVLSGNARA